jgi:selenocysteine lyase/cysteine desulfurase
MSLSQPDFTPDKFESGTLNNLGIISLGSGIDFINSVGMENIYSHEMALAKGLYNPLSHIEGVKLYTPIPKMYKSMPIISFNLKDYSSEKVANELARHNVCVRAGFHCSPLAHKHFGTQDIGAVRVSIGYFNNEVECNKLLNLVKKL